MILLHHPGSVPLNRLVGALIVLGVMLYAYGFYDLYRHGALRSLRRRGLIRGYQIALFAAGIAVLIVALLSSLDERADERFSSHMIQHVLLTMVAPPLMLLGLPSPIGRAALSRSWLRQLVARVTDPVVTFAVFFLNLYVWHIPVLYEMAGIRYGLGLPPSGCICYWRRRPAMCWGQCCGVAARSSIRRTLGLAPWPISVWAGRSCGSRVGCF